MIATEGAPPRALPRPSFQADALRALMAGKVFYLPTADRLYPGYVLAPGGKNGRDGCGRFRRLITLSAELHESGSHVSVTRRPLMGGTAATVAYPVHRRVRVHGSGPRDLFTPELVPAVPAVEIPEDPQDGDEIWSQNAESGGAAGTLRYTYRAGSWIDMRAAERGEDARTDAAALRRAVLGRWALASEWFVYRGAGAPVELYVDGQRFLAVPAPELRFGDVLPAPGGASLVVTRVSDVLGDPTMVRLGTVMQAPSAYSWAFRYRGAVPGAEGREYLRKTAWLPVVR